MSPMRSLNFNGKDRGCESAAKILTVRQIKMEQAKMKEKEEDVARLSNSSSKRILVTLSKKNRVSQEKNKQADLEIK